MEKILIKSGMNNMKPISIPLASHFYLSQSLCPSSKEENDYMSCISYFNVVGCLIYEIVCTILDISHATAIVNKYLYNPSIEHWKSMKRVF